MNERQTITESNQEPNQNKSDIGTGKKIGLYGCAFLILAIIVFFIVLALTGIFVPLEGTEGVGPGP